MAIRTYFVMKGKMEDDFSGKVKDCNYKDERYSVRDNGAVWRHAHEGKRARRTDNQWTFGKPNERTGYMEIASVRVHRIVATAFHGEPPTKEHVVVDHIDTNKRNNRPENLRWVTRLDNVLLNPITAKRIAFICGSVEAFLADPSKFRDLFNEPDISWMRTVSVQEAHVSYERLLAWAKSDKRPSGGSLDEWIYNRANPQHQHIEAKTVNAAQRNWSIQCEFPCCPQEYVEEPIIRYAEKLKIGSVFCRNDGYSLLVSKNTISNDGQWLYVISKSTKNYIKPWALAKITYENGLFVHWNLGSFFEQNGAEKQICIEQGLEWTGGDTMDDYI